MDGGNAMKKKIGFLVVLVSIILTGTYLYLAPKPLAKDLKSPLVNLSAMTDLIIVDSQKETMYRTSDTKEFQAIYSQLLQLEVTKGKDVELDESAFRKNDMLHVRFYNNESQSYISYTLYDDHYLIVEEQSLVTKTVIGREVSEEEFVQFYEYIQAGRTFE